MKRWLAGILAAAMGLLCMIGAEAEGSLRVMKETDGKKVTYTFVDEKGRAASGPEGYAIVECEYADGGRKTLNKIRFTDRNGYRKENANGYAVIRFLYNGNNQIKEADFYGRDGNLKETKQEYAKVTVVYEDRTVSGVYYYNEKN